MSPHRRRAVIILPNGFTLASLFFGIFAIVTASRGDHDVARAAVYIVLGGVADALDGRVARATGTGSRFGSELDSLVDAITFGLAPALLVYFAEPRLAEQPVLNREGWDWIFVFLFTACAVIRLARFNIEQAGRAKRYFHGLPSPAAGITLATYFWMRGTDAYQHLMTGLPWPVLLRYLMVLLGFLMISNVSYPAVPTIGFRKLREIIGTLVVVAAFVGLLFAPRELFFPAMMLYVLYGLAKTAFYGLLGLRSQGDALLYDDGEQPGVVPDELAPTEPDERLEREPGRRRRRRRRRPRSFPEDPRE